MKTNKFHYFKAFLLIALSVTFFIACFDTSEEDDDAACSSSQFAVRFKNSYTSTHTYSLYTASGCGGTAYDANGWSGISYGNTGSYVCGTPSYRSPGWSNGTNCGSTTWYLGAGRGYTIIEYSGSYSIVAEW
jgi:hypothetical protein